MYDVGSWHHLGMSLAVRVTGLASPWLFAFVLGCSPASSGDETETGDSETGDTEGVGGECITDEGRLALTGLLLHEQATVFDSDGGRWLQVNITGGEQIELKGAGRGEHVVVARNREKPSSNDDEAVVHVFDRASGELQWDTTLNDARVEQMWVSEDGWVSGALELDEFGAPGLPVGFVASADETHALLSYQPLTAVQDGRVAAVEIVPNTIGEVGWLTIADMTWVAAQPSPSQLGVRVVDEQTLEYVAQGAEGEVFVRATLDGSETFEFPGGQVTPMGGRGSYRLLQTLNLVEAVPRFARLDIESGEILVIDPELPAEWSHLDCAGRNARIDDNGTVLFELELLAADIVAVWAYAPEDDTWTQLGSDVSGVADIEILGDVGSAYAVLFYPRDELFACGQDNSWLVNPNSLQVVRHEPPLAIELEGREVAMDSQQRCMAHYSDSAWQVRSLATNGAEDVPVAETYGTWVWLD
jgi:hypothetical protein